MTVKSLNLKEIKSVLFVCMGNICRSPSAEAVFRQKAKQQGINIIVDSAGIIGAHTREKPDIRAKKAATTRGYSFDGIKSRQVKLEDFDKFDLILAMDLNNVEHLKQIAPQHLQEKIKLLLSFASNTEEQEVPDPYYGGAKGFQYVLDLIEDASDGLLEKLCA